MLCAHVARGRCTRVGGARGNCSPCPSSITPAPLPPFNKTTPTPSASLPAGFSHPNVYPSGQICLSIINDYQEWSPSISVKQILQGVQELLRTPNALSPAQAEATRLFRSDVAEYERRARALAKRYAPDDGAGE